MKWWLGDWRNRYELLEFGDDPPEGYKLVDFHDSVSYARSFLDELARDDQNLLVFRSFLAWQGKFDLTRMDDHRVLQELAWAVESGRLNIASKPFDR